jgi:hypothetical protein
MKRSGFAIATGLFLQAVLFSTSAFAVDAVGYYVNMLEQHGQTWVAAGSAREAEALYSGISSKAKGPITPYEKVPVMELGGGKINFFIRGGR